MHRPVQNFETYDSGIEPLPPTTDKTTAMGMEKSGEELGGGVLKCGEKSSDLSLRRKRNASEVEPSDQKNEKRNKIQKSLRRAGVVGKCMYALN